MIGISYHAGGMKDIPLQEVITILADTGYDAIEMMCGPEAVSYTHLTLPTNREV